MDHGVLVLGGGAGGLLIDRLYRVAMLRAALFHALALPGAALHLPLTSATAQGQRIIK